MSQPQFVAALLWGILGLSTVLTLVGIPFRHWRLLCLAAVCSLIFALAALASIGAIVVLLTIVQTAVAIVFYRVDRERLA